MTAYTYITDGTTEVNLVDGTIIYATGGRGTGQQQGLDDPPALMRLAESWKLILQGDDPDVAALNLRTFRGLLMKAWEYWNTNWQTTPVYMGQKLDGETNFRYAWVYGPTEFETPDWFHRFEVDCKWREEFGEGIIRGVWRGVKPGTNIMNVPAGDPVTTSSAIPCTMPSGRTPSVVPVITNGYDGVNCDTIFNYDASLAAWSANLSGTANIPIWSVAAAVPAAGDIIYFGSTAFSPRTIVMEMQTAGVFTADVVAEYWNGAAWTALTTGVTIYSWPNWYGDLFKSGAGTQIYFAINWPANAALTIVNAVNAVWVRFRLNAVTAWTTTPVLSATAAYGPHAISYPFVDIPSTAVKGDLNALMAYRMYGGNGIATATPGFGALSRVIVGAKSRGLGSFVSHLNLGGNAGAGAAGNPAAWTTAYGTDTANLFTVQGPYWCAANCTFATATAMTTRVILGGANMYGPWWGEYRVFVRAMQVGGANGDVRVRLKTSLWYIDGTGSAVLSPIATLQTHDVPWEIADLGILTIPFTDVVSGVDATALGLYFEVQAELLTGAADVYLADLILIPIDEWSNTWDDFVKSVVSGASALHQNNMLDVDGDVAALRTCKEMWLSGSSYFPLEDWAREGPPPMLKPGRRTKLFFLMGHYPVTFGTGPFIGPIGMAFAMNLFTVPVYETLRGAD